MLQGFVGGGDATEIDLDLLVAADAGDLVVLQHAQQIGLRLQADVADLVEKNRAAFGDLKFPFLAILGAGERSLFVAEQLAFQQRFGQRAAMDHHQWMITPRAGIVDGASHQFFSRAAFAGDQHRGIGGTDGFNGVHHAPHGRAVAHQLIGTRDLRVLFAEALVFLLRTLMRERLAHLEGDVFGVERLGHVIVGAVLHRRHRGLDRGIAGHHDGDQPRIDLVHAALQFDAVGAAHLDVEQRDIPLLFRHPQQRLAGAFRGAHLVAFFSKPLIQ